MQAHEILVPLLLLVGMVATISVIPTLYAGWASRKWTRTAGTIRAAKIGRRREPQGWRDGGPDNYAYLYYARLDYEYTVDGNGYRSERIGFGGDITDSDERIVRAWLAERHLRAGKQIAVFYNPRKPDKSVLIPGTPLNSYTQLVAGVVLNVLGITTLVR